MLRATAINAINANQISMAHCVDVEKMNDPKTASVLVNTWRRNVLKLA